MIAATSEKSMPELIDEAVSPQFTPILALFFWSLVFQSYPKSVSIFSICSLILSLEGSMTFKSMSRASSPAAIHFSLILST